jgi:anaerobic ribonucleoside-triphosphate reductase activating protein
LQREIDPELNVALIVPRTEAEGPGERFAVWVQGCPMRCPGCCNPEMLTSTERERVLASELARRALSAGVEGVSFLGGEPFAQADGLAYVARAVRAGGLSVMIFSGYTLAEIKALPGPGPEALLAAADLLVDGRYEAARRTTRRRWIGSDNQALHFLSARYSPLDPRFYEDNHLEIRFDSRGVLTINGFPYEGARTGPSFAARPRTEPEGGR